MEKWWFNPKSRKVTLSLRLLFKKMAAFIIFIMHDQAVADHGLLKGLGFSVRDQISGETLALCRVDLISEQLDPVGFLNIAVRRRVLINIMDVEVYSLDGVKGIIDCVKITSGVSMLPVVINLAKIKFDRANVVSIIMRGCRCFSDGSIVFKSGDIEYCGAICSIPVVDGSIGFGKKGAIVIRYLYNGSVCSCEMVALK